MKNQFLLSIFFLIGCSYVINAQNVSTFTPQINNLPTSPEAALLERFKDIPVSHYTGTANVSVPLYTVKESGVEFPIQLRYHSSGIKVSDEATWVGLGWDLSPGGEIIQEVRGKRDEYEVPYLNSSPEEYANFQTRLQNAGPLGLYKFLNQKGRAYYEFFNGGCTALWPPADSPDDDANGLVGNLLQGGGNPDIFHYNFAGYSGKFYINPETDQIVLIDKNKDIKFEFLGPTAGWKATTLDGTQFTFGAVEIAYELGQYEHSPRSGRTFKLSNVYFTNGKSINLNYANAQLTGGYYKQRGVLYTLIADDGGAPGPPQWVMTQSEIKILSSITTDEEVINFNLEGRDDLYQDPDNPVKRLKSIDIFSNVSGRKIKSFDFGYSYFPYNFIGSPKPSAEYTAAQKATFGNRLKLDSIKEIGYNDSGISDLSKPPHTFEYDLSATMPLKNSFAVDFYGYYNGENNDKLLPDLDYFDYPYTYKVNTSNNLFTYKYTGANRYTNNVYAGAYLLKKINYPTGGYSEFDYESHSFTNQFIPNHTQVEDAYKFTLLQDKNTSTDVVGKTFQISKSTTITFDNSIYDGYITNMASGYSYDEMLGSKIEVLKVDMTGGTPVVTYLKKWDLSTVLRAEFEADHGKEWKENLRLNYDPNPNIYYTVNVHLPSNLINNTYGSVSVKSRFYFYDDTGVDTSISNQCGVRIKSIKNYSQPDELTSHKSYKYYDGKLLNRFEPIHSQTLYHFKYYGGCPDGISTNFNELSVYSDLVKGGGNLIGYGKVEELDVSANNSSDDIGKKSFNYFNTENLSSPLFPTVANLKNGQLLNESYFDTAGKLLVDKKYIYEDLNPEMINCFYGLTVIQNFRGDYDPLDKGLGTIDSRSKYSYLATPIISEWNKLEKVVTNEYLDGNILTTSEEYNYNDKGSIRSITTNTSDNRSLTTKYYYPQDAEMGAKPYRNSLIANNIFEPALVTQKLEGTNKLFEQELKYGAFGGLLLPQFIYAGKGTAATEKKVTYDQYDSKGNVLQYTLADGTPVAILWGFNQTLPIAKIENATYSQASSVSGSLQANLPGAQVTTYTYDPLVGVTSITDPKGNIITYTYEPFGRLEIVKDENGNILSQHQYKYKD